MQPRLVQRHERRAGDDCDPPFTKLAHDVESLVLSSPSSVRRSFADEL